MLEALLSWDERYFRLIQNAWASPMLDRVLPLVTDARNYTLPFVLAAILILVVGRLQGSRFLVLAVVSVVLADAISTHLIKPVVWRVRPCIALETVRLLAGCVDSPSFPSNHAVNSGALATLVALYMPRLALPSAALAVLVGYSRVYVGAHYPLDVIAGWVLGFGVALALAGGMAAVWPLRAAPEARRGLSSLRFGNH